MMLFHVDVPIFQMAVVVCADCEVRTAVNMMYDYEGHRTILEPRDCPGWVQHAGGDIYMYVRDSEKGSLILHELTHVAFSICEIRGMSYDEELICYLVGWLKLNVLDRMCELRMPTGEEEEGSE